MPTLRIRAVNPAGDGVPDLTVTVTSDGSGERWSARAVTGQDGLVVVTDLPLGPARFRTPAGQEWVYPTPSVMRDCADPAEVFVGVDKTDAVLPVVRAASLSVRVADEAGAPIGGVAVLHGPRDLQWMTTAITTPEGTCRLDRLEPGSGGVGVVLRPQEGDPRRGRWVDLFRWVSLVPGEEAALELTVRRGASGAVTCDTRLASGAAASGAEMRLVHGEAPRASSCRRVSVGVDGIARFDHLQPGRYHVLGPGSSGPPVATVEVDQTEVGVSLVLADRANLEVAVVDPDGRPVAAASVLFQAIPTNEQANGTTDPEGRTRFAAVPCGEAYLAFRVPGFLDRTQTIRHDGSPRRTVISPCREIVVRGRVPEGLEGAGVGVCVAVTGDELRVGGGKHRVQNGVFEHRATVAPGEGGTVVVRVADRVPIVLPFEAGDTSIDLGTLALDGGATLRGRVGDRGWAARGGFTWLEVRTATHGTFHQYLRSDGTFEVRGVPVEDVELYISVSDGSVDRRQLSATIRLIPAAGVQDLGQIELHEHP